VYCDFYSITDSGLTERFIDALTREFELRARSVTQSGNEFTSVYFGGGTPSLLAASQVARILDALKQQFPVAADAEISMECNPGTLSDAKLAGYREAGVNRLSIGVQSFDDADLRFLSRIHTAEQARESVQRARSAGFTNINIDLMFALPHQRLDAWKHNLDIALELGVPHLSCYSLTIEPSTPLAKLVRAQPGLRADAECDAELFEYAMEFLANAGYAHYEVSNYALPGFECRHNLSYWALEDYLGFGPSAHGTWETHRYWNIQDVGLYCGMVESGLLPRHGGEEMTLEMRREEHLFLSLRSTGLDIGQHKAQFGIDIMKENGDVIQSLLHEELLALREGALHLTPKGFVVCDEICERLM
jgi:oxygen-independent coproporphyrinogen-3 oxidase